MKPDRALKEFSALSATFFLAGCMRAHNVEIVGSYFPFWLLCMIVGVAVAFASRIVLVRLKIEPYVGPLTLIYVCILVASSCLVWLLIS